MVILNVKFKKMLPLRPRNRLKSEVSTEARCDKRTPLESQKSNNFRK
ncbi:MAG: hypothetical protein RL329_1034 [Bacteroidota bacterium]|jgi:hypothetical protein